MVTVLLTNEVGDCTKKWAKQYFGDEEVQMNKLQVTPVKHPWLDLFQVLFQGLF